MSLFGEFEPEFLHEVMKLTETVNRGKIAVNSEWIFLAADSKQELGTLPKISKAMKGAAAVWVVYPKGQKHITENDVLAAGRKAGLKDVKVVGFCATHTALISRSTARTEGLKAIHSSRDIADTRSTSGR